MPIRISDKHDAMIMNLVAGQNLSSANTDSLLSAVKTKLDADFINFKGPDGDYNKHHVRAAYNFVVNRGK
jgi:hypothetical protein